MFRLVYRTFLRHLSSIHCEVAYSNRQPVNVDVTNVKTVYFSDVMLHEMRSQLFSCLLIVSGLFFVFDENIAMKLQRCLDYIRRIFNQFKVVTNA